MALVLRAPSGSGALAVFWGVRALPGGVEPGRRRDRGGPGPVQRGRYNGAGIAGDVPGRIFNSFFSARDGAPGAGLGLKAAADVFRRDGGGLSVETVRGESSGFLMELPSGSARVPAA